MDDSISHRRDEIYDLLSLISDKYQQIEYQEKVPYANVSTELFLQWEDMYFPDSDLLQAAFSEEGRKILSEFNEIFLLICDQTLQILPSLDKFQETKEWGIYSAAARNTLEKLKLDEKE
ncbi:hypothetical protein ACE5IS_19735 [Leptospira wolffii]|uniref:Uncharacterized protein n=1 Tax=Leptospira wolffii TaxID=409998 RepID=A0ABV5BTY7_9LEPT